MKRATGRVFGSPYAISVVFLCITLSSFSIPAWSVGFQPISLDELKMTGNAKAPGAPAIILFREVDRDDRGRTAHEDVYFRIKILTEEGRKYADIEIPFYRQEGDVVGIHARTVEPDGTIVNFSGKAFTKEIVKARRQLSGQNLYSTRCSGGQHSRILLHP